jgi:hypothetical protein
MRTFTLKRFPDRGGRIMGGEQAYSVLIIARALALGLTLAATP